MRTLAVIVALALSLGGCASARSESSSDLVYVANGSGSRAYDEMRSRLGPLGITPRCLGSIRYGVWVEANAEARARAVLEPLSRELPSGELMMQTEADLPRR